MKVLAGDIGGTKCLLGLVEVDGGRTEILAESLTASVEHDGIASVLRVARRELGEDWVAAGLGLPGPVVAGECFLPKLGWRIGAEEVRAELGTSRVILLNDFVAVGHGLDALDSSDLRALQPGTAEPNGPRAFLGAGTGLGEGYALWHDGHWDVHPSEGGSTDFAPRNAQGCRFLEFVRERIGRAPNWDDVLSGRGLVDLWRFTTEVEGVAITPAVSSEMEAGDLAAVVSKHGLERTDAGCARALDLFCEHYAAEAGNQALRHVATGGVYLAGGITPRIVERLDTDAFRATFCDKGPMRELAEKIPVHAVLEPRVGLIGAAVAGAGLSA